MDRFQVFTTTFLKINRLVSKIKTIEMQEYGLKGTTIMCLYFASKLDNLTSSDLVKLCQEDFAINLPLITLLFFCLKQLVLT